MQLLQFLAKIGHDVPDAAQCSTSVILAMLRDEKDRKAIAH